MSAESVVNQIITNATTAANTARDKAISYADAAKTAADSALVDLGTIHSPTEPHVAVFPFTPTEDLSGLFGTAVDNIDASLKADFTTKTNDFLNTWFPDWVGCLKTNVEGWICSTIQNGATGIPTAVENQIWERSRNRELRESARLKSEATEALASRGFSLPSGVLYAQLAQIDQEAANKVSTHNRDVAIKQVDVQIETIKFAVDKGVALRLGVVQALISYLGEFFKVPQLATERAKIKAELKRGLWEASSAYYRALIDAARLTLDYDKLMVDKDLTVEGHTVESFVHHAEARVKAAVSAAEEMGKIAQAALSAQNTLAEIGSQQITS